MFAQRKQEEKTLQPTTAISALYSFKRKGDVNTYSALHVDDKSDQILKKAIKNCLNDPRYSIRFAFLNWPRQGKQEFRCKVGLPLEVKREQTNYEIDEVVQSNQNRAGIVHEELLNKINQSETVDLDPSGGSFKLYVKNNILYIYPSNRTAKNTRVFTVSDIGKSIFLFDTENANFNKQNKVFDRFSRTYLYHILRSQPEKPFRQIMQLFVEHLKKISAEFGFKNVVLVMLPTECYSFRNEEKLEKILQGKKETISQDEFEEEEWKKELRLIMQENLYIAVGTATRFDAKVDQPNSQHKTYSGYEEEVKKILKTAKDLGIDLDFNHVPVQFELMDCDIAPIGMAAKNGYTQFVKLFLDNDVTVDSEVDDKGSTPLFLAAEKNKIDTARLLIRRKAAPFYQRKDGKSPLHLVKSAEMLTFFLTEIKHENRNVIDARDTQGMTPLHCAVLSTVTEADKTAENRMELIKTFIGAKANPYLPDKNGHTPLYTAVSYKDEEMVKYLLNHVDPSVPVEGRSFLRCVAIQKDTNILKLLLKDRRLNLSECKEILKEINDMPEMSELGTAYFKIFSEGQKKEFDLLKEKSHLLTEYIKSRIEEKEKPSLRPDSTNT